VDIWGVNRSTRAAEASLAAQKAAAAAADLTVASSVASGYVTLLSLDEQLRVTESTLKSREEAFNLAKRQFETGYSSRLELMQSDSELRSTRAQVPVLQHQIAQQENALSLLLGSNPARGAQRKLCSTDAADAAVAAAFYAAEPSAGYRSGRTPAGGGGCLARGVARQPAAVDQPDRHRIGSGSHPFRPAGQPASALERRGSILAPLLNRQALNAQVDISQSQRNQALYAYEKTVRNAFAEVNNSLDAITRYQEQLTELLAQQDVAQETLRIAQNRYRNGYSSYLDVLDAQRTLFSVQTSVVQVKNNLLLAQIDLYRALGGGWVSAEPRLRA
jgi:outer membrane protein TolC